MATDLSDLRTKVEAGLSLFTTDESDATIGEQTDEYRALIQAGEALVTMLWMVAKANGAKDTKSALVMMAQGETMLLTLLHNAFAAGIRMERERGA